MISLDWFIHSFILVGLIAGDYFIKNTILKFTEFNKKLETHKYELNKITEAAKIDYQRMLSGLNLYAARRHENYAKLHSSIVKANNYILDYEALDHIRHL